MSLDGFVETPDHGLDWALVDEELHSWFNDQAGMVDAFLYGRRLYELMAAYWPTAESDSSATPSMLEFARIWRAKPKIVFSTTLETVESAFIERDLVDEYRILIHPVVLGAGTRFFPGLDRRLRLRLLETRTFQSGVVYLGYAAR